MCAVPSGPIPIVGGDIVALPEISILGIKVNPITEDELNREIARIIRAGGKELVLNVNVNAVNQALKHPFMKELLNRAGIVFCDGYGVILGARILGASIPPERITYADWMWSLSALCEREGFSFYFLGAREGIAAIAADKLRGKYPSLKIVGIRSGYFTNTGRENEKVIDLINRSRPDILVLGLGMPLQERWLADNWTKIDARVALTGGGCFDFISGTVKRAPRWMSDNGLEWLFRYLLEPRRMFVRYIIGNPLFIARVIRERLVHGRSGKKVYLKSG
jgi:N-acetylglucosaminyldiphosphoundecaprenol N-acetyl-beta-D-mannosaminyltransferase